MSEETAETTTSSRNPKLEALFKNALLINERKNAEQKRLREETVNASIKKPVQSTQDAGHVAPTQINK
jgi:hypothetical protein